MNILFVIPYYAPAWGYGGPPVIITSVAQELAKRGHTISVYTTDALSATKRATPLVENIHRVSITRCPNLFNRLAWSAKLFWPKGFKQLVDRNIYTFDYVFLSDLRTYQNMVTARACQRQGIPYCIAAFGQLPYATGVKVGFKRLYDYFWGYSILRNANLLLAQTDHEADLYRQYGADKRRIKLWPLGIDTSGLTKLQTTNPLKKTHIGNTPYILFVGRLHPYKGVSMLIHALPILKKYRPDLKLVIVGRDDGDEANLKALVKTLGLTQCVIWTGPLYGDDNTAVYQDATVFAFTPSHFEETSLAALKALALGIPVVTTKQAGIPWLEKYQAGFIIERNHEALLTALLTIIQNSAKQKAMGQQAIKLIHDHFTIHVVANQFLSFIQ